MKRKMLLIGGTGTISQALTQLISAQPDWELTLLNRGSHSDLPAGVRQLTADFRDEAHVAKLLEGESFDAAADFICFTPEQAQQDVRLFQGKVGQFFFISSATVYQRPPRNYLITEGSGLSNPDSQYAQNKMACEQVFLDAFRNQGFPATIIRPSSTYDNTSPKVAIRSPNGCWPVIRRMLEGKPVLVPGDGTSLWVYTHNSDFAKGFFGLMGNPKAIGEAFHITSDEVLSWNQIYTILGQAVGVTPKLYHVASDFLARCLPSQRGSLHGDMMHSMVLDNRKLKEAVPGFCAQVRLDQGVRTAVDYLLSHPEAQLEDPEFDQWCDRVIEAQEAAFRWYSQQ